MAKLDYIIVDLLESTARNIKAHPLNLGGIAGGGGGLGGPPGGFIGWLPQTRVAYDEDEFATLFTPSSGMSLLDNLNHIRYRLNILESGASITVIDDDIPLTVYDVDTIHFSGAGVLVTDLGGGDVRVTVNATGSGGMLIVEEYDGNPSISNVDTIIFSGLSVTDLGNGDVLVAGSGLSGDFVEVAGDTMTGDLVIDGRELQAQAILHNDSGISFREQNVDGSFVWIKGDVGSGGISGYLRSHLQAFINTSELITNGTFETGDFTGWTQTGSPVITTTNPFKGIYSAKCTAANTISQTLTVTNGAYYLLEFAVKKDGDSDFHGIVTITNGDQANYDAGSQYGGKWIRGACLIKTTSTSLVLEFKAAGGTNFVYFDNITVKLCTAFSLEGMDSSHRWNVISTSASPLLINGVDVAAKITDENIQDVAGGMVTGNTETGISVTYDDPSGKLNFDAQTAGDARYAPIAKGVTNGDSHNHVGGDGAALNYTDVIGSFTAGATVPATTTYSNCPFKGTLDATQNSLSWPDAGTLSYLSVRISTAQSGTGTLVATLYVNNSATSIVVTIAAGAAAGTYTDTTNTVAINATDLIRWDLQNNATVASALVTGFTMRITKTTT